MKTSPISRFKLFANARPSNAAAAIRDLLAGFQLAAMNVPQALGYTKIAGTPIVTGFYTLLLPIVGFAAFGSSRYLVVAADSATAAILASGLADMAPIASARYVALAGTVALLTGGFLLAARLLKLGFLADFLSQTVLVGFLTGVGFQVGIAVLGEMLGVETHSRRAIGQLGEVIDAHSSIHPTTACISVAVVAVIMGLHWISSRIPGALIAVFLAIAASAYWDLAARGVEVIGPVSGGLPRISIPEIRPGDINALVPLAVSCFVMIVAQSAATARFYASRHHQQLDENDDLVGLSAANSAAALTGTFVVDGSPTQTAMVESSGGRSQLAQLATAAVVALVLLFLTGPMQDLPRCALGAIVFVIAVRLIDVRGLQDIQRESPVEFALALFTAAIVVLVGVEQAIILAMVLSLLHVFNHSYHPQTGVMVTTTGDVWETTPPVPGAFSRPGLIIYRFGAGLFYANASRFSEEIRELVAMASPATRWVIVEAEAITNIDYSAARMIREVHAALQQRDIFFGMVHVASTLHADLIRHRIADLIGANHIFPHVHDVLAAFAAAEKGAQQVSPD